MPGDIDDAEAYSLLMSYPEETDYYALLGLPREPPPTDAAIRSAYRTLTLSFHPDKQPAELREAARRQFSRIQEAYETLIDPKKRVVYDALGAEGVREEWGAGGIMGRGRETGRKELGVKTMKPEEFKRWFFERMKRRERSALEEMVKSKGFVKLGINAAHMIELDDTPGEEEIRLHAPELSDFALRYSFAVPFPLWGIWGEREKDKDKEEEVDGEGSEESTESAEVEENEGPEVSINAGISGHFQRLFNKVEIEFDDGETDTRVVPLPLILSTQAVSLGASVNQVIRGLSGTKGVFGRWPLSVLQNSIASVNATVLPAPSLETSVAKSFALIPNTRPFTVMVDTAFSHSILQALPSVGLQVTKGIGAKKTAFCHWTSGFIGWPFALRALLAPIVALGEDDFLLEQAVSQFQFGIASRPPRPVASMAEEDEDEPQPEEDEDEDEEYANLRVKEREERRVAEAWTFAASASPVSNGLIFKYSRNIFSGRSAIEPALSQWSSEKHYSIPPETEPRSVRLEINSTIDQNLSLSLNMQGSRQITDLTRMGIGVGLQPRGLVLTVLWSRLGQKVSVPIALCPLESTTSNAATFALALPWLTYCAVEFGFIRPRNRRNRRKLIARRAKQLRKLVPQKRAEAMQAVELMADQVQRRQEKEAVRGGLVITKAEYGHYPTAKQREDDETKEPEVADVTVAVAALVDHGQLIISNKTVKFHILGFHDPAPLKPKVLKIWYHYHGKEHYVEADDSEGVTCPMRVHLRAE
ncbi:hypothetical protein BJX61DRAFT_531174 [Aspergillus egyptiacus]|nr:hypothetical protein BJX61DRAFT_531174 [Aspergillus egyptiacus]